MEEVTVVKKGRVLEILLNRPKVNAIDLATSRKLGDAFVCCVMIRNCGWES